MTDSALMAAVSNGDQRAMAEVDARFRNRLEAYVSKRCRDFAVVEDVVQESLLKCWQKANTFRDGAEIWNWLVIIAKRSLIDAVLRDQSGCRMVCMSATAGDESDSDPMVSMAVVDGEQEVVDRREFVRRMLSGLTSEERTVVTARYLRGLSDAEVAEELGMSRGKVWHILNSARDVMRHQAMAN